MYIIHKTILWLRWDLCASAYWHLLRDLRENCWSWLVKCRDTLSWEAWPVWRRWWCLIGLTNVMICFRLYRLMCCQKVWASSFLPNEPSKKDATQRAYYERKGSVMLVDYAALELKKKVSWWSLLSILIYDVCGLITVDRLHDYICHCLC